MASVLIVAVRGVVELLSELVIKDKRGVPKVNAVFFRNYSVIQFVGKRVTGAIYCGFW